ncbi:RNA-binding KH domain-containing protein [Actinidia rufa]|uniref:RNA-binding KH domain-containing protein n=1 Tax=Actinidia rufa TaxID=165716 RepID=A0A7J0FF47_9ERIC|nr:RNA-binding KH domain-containing protein [Actinidia rufa]
MLNYVVSACWFYIYNRNFPAVRKALLSVSSCLQENPMSDAVNSAATRSLGIHGTGMMALGCPLTGAENVGTNHKMVTEEEVVFSLPPGCSAVGKCGGGQAYCMRASQVRALSAVLTLLFTCGRSQPSNVASTTVEVVIPQTLLSHVFGENHGNLSQIRQISGAKVVVHNPIPGGATEGMVVVSGTPDQIHAAQSLIHAFILAELPY